MRLIPYGRQNVGHEDIEAVTKILQSDWITQGPMLEQFEEAVAIYCGAKYAVAVSSGTAALHLACLASDLGIGDTLWTSPNTFVASANCARYCGADVDFVDIDAKTYNMSLEHLRERLSRANQVGKLPKVIVPVHFAGQSCDVKAISELAANYGITVIEDACHAIGGRFDGEQIGSCQYSDMTVFSFHPVKIITTGEGGMILTNRFDLYQRLRRLRNHGITREECEWVDTTAGPWYYEQKELGFNYRMTDIQAALGLSQLNRIDTFVAQRHQLASNYNTALSKLPLTLPWQDVRAYSSFHLYVVRLHLPDIDRTRKQIVEDLRGRGILVNVHYIPVHLQPYYQVLGFHIGDFPEAEKYYSEAMTLPLYYSLDSASQTYVIDNLYEVLR